MSSSPPASGGVGTCAEDFDAFSAEIAAACYARDAVILRHDRWANLLTVEIVRGGEATGPAVGLDRFYGRANWVSPQAGRAAEEKPGTRFTAVPRPGPDELPKPDGFPGSNGFAGPDGFPEPDEFPGRRRQAA
ncbi:hypothetical protein [Streptosporangium sp. V21-05]|uniref:hypothetical protein n=1 Tax=Streptosporangium sp. V21-05 TaxID=3446115 RepID=UPI003F52E76E